MRTSVVEQVFRDLRYVVRALLRSPIFTRKVRRNRRASRLPKTTETRSFENLPKLQRIASYA